MPRGKNQGPWGKVAVCAGTVILMGLILPHWFWWLVCGVLLVWGGIWMLRC